MFCPSCGFQIPDEAKFCVNCGNAVPGSKEKESKAEPEPKAEVGPTPEEQKMTKEIVPVAPPPPLPVLSNQIDTNYENSDQPPKTPQKKPNLNMILIGAIAVLILIAIITITVITVTAANEQKAAEERDASVTTLAQRLYSSAEVINPDTGSNASRSVLLQQYSTLTSAKNDLQTAEQNGDLTLANGVNYDIAADITAIDSKIAMIRNWFLSDYESTLKKSKLSSKATAKNTSTSKCNKKLNALKKLKERIEGEKDIWGGQTENGSQYSKILSKVNKQIDLCNSMLKKIKAYQKKKREEARRAALERKANGFIGRWISYSGTTSDITFYSGHSGVEEYGTTYYYFNWSRSSISNDMVTITLRFYSTASSSYTGTEYFRYYLNTEELIGNSSRVYHRF